MEPAFQGGLKSVLRSTATARGLLHADAQRRSGRLVFRKAAVFFQYGPECVVGEGERGVAVAAGHGFGGDEGVNNGFFGGLHDRGKERVEVRGRKHLDGAGLAGDDGHGIARGKGDEEIAGAVAGDAAVAREAEGGAFGEAF